MASRLDSQTVAATAVQEEAADVPSRLERAEPWLFIAPSLILLLAVGLYPVVYTGYMSLHNWTLGMGAPTFTGFDNFANAITSEAFRASVGRTLLLLVITLPVELVLGLAIALALNVQENRVLRTILQVALVVPIAITPAVVGLLVQLLFDNQLGVINHFLAQVGLANVDWLGDPTMAYVTVCIAQIWQWTPFVALVLSASLATVPGEIEEAALLETERWWPRFRKVQLPFLWPGITAALVFQTAFVMKQFGMIYAIQKGGPGSATQTAMLQIERTAFRGFDIGLASAQSILMLIISIVLAQIYIKAFYSEAE
ncbi:carbohydrate ABC transporter permease [Arhodomonas sp. AD133]|uniref:carbohydrate ABC transporter permease n=1 Tax=Arhodomonas sp. AD133 TaxID=3415009 RepID=UPI003EBF3BAA